MHSKKSSIPGLTQQSKANLNKVKILKLTSECHFKTKDLCMAFSHLETCEKHGQHDLQRLGKDRVVKEFQ